MESFVNFIKEYGALLLAALSVIVGVIAAIIKRRPKTLSQFLNCCDEVALKIPAYVSQFESKFGAGHGTEKKTAVLTTCLELLKDLLGRDTDEAEGNYAFKLFSGFIEMVLDTPTKKGGN